MFEAPEACNAYVTLRHTSVKYHLSNFLSKQIIAHNVQKGIDFNLDRVRSM